MTENILRIVAFSISLYGRQLYTDDGFPRDGARARPGQKHIRAASRRGVGPRRRARLGTQRLGSPDHDHVQLRDGFYYFP